VRDGVLKLLDISWYDAALKLTISLLATAILWTAWSTGALFNNFPQLYSTRLGAALMTLGIVYSFFMLAVTLVRATLVFPIAPLIASAATPPMVCVPAQRRPIRARDSSPLCPFTRAGR
jgi:hypothetical protein